jgi:hypothetical protein
MLEYLALGAAGFVAYWLFLRDPYEHDGAMRFRDRTREKILAALNSTVPIPTAQPSYPNASVFLVARFDPASTASTFVVEQARASGLPVAISDYALDVIADPNDNRPVHLIVMAKGAEQTICAPGSGHALIAD